MNRNFNLWEVLCILGVFLLGCITWFNFQSGFVKERYEATIKEKDATIENLRENLSPNLSQWDYGTVECIHDVEKLVKFNVKFTTPPAIIANLGSDVYDPVAIIISSITQESFVLKVEGSWGRPFHTGNLAAKINWVALSKK